MAKARTLLSRLAASITMLLWSAPAIAQTANPGKRYAEIDSAVVYVSTWYDRVKATSARRPDGAIDTVIEDERGQVLAHSRHKDGVLDADIAGPLRLSHYRASLDTSTTHSTDWFNQQLHVLWSDQDEINRTPALMNTPQNGVWHRGYLRLRDQVERGRLLKMPDPVDDQGLAARTQYDGYFAYSAVEPAPIKPLKKGVVRPAFTTRWFDKDGKEVGLMRWYSKPRALSWKFANGDEGVAPEWRVPGGYKFTPTLAWAGIQAMAFQQERTPEGVKIIRTQGEKPGFLARVGGAIGRTWTSVVSFIAPTLSAQSAACDHQSDGCTGLHFLDGTVFQDCCDRHDLCFEMDCNNVCTKISWIWPFGNWRCAGCDFNAVLCFATTIITSGEPGPPPPQGNPACYDNDVCTRCTMAEWCPAECQTCDGIDPSAPPGM